jgi:hypothetical protein
MRGSADQRRTRREVPDVAGVLDATRELEAALAPEVVLEHLLAVREEGRDRVEFWGGPRQQQ